MRLKQLADEMHSVERTELDRLSEAELNVVSKFTEAGYQYLDHGRSRVVFLDSNDVVKIARPLYTNSPRVDGTHENKSEAQQWESLTPEQREYVANIKEYDSSDYTYLRMERVQDVLHTDEALEIRDSLDEVGLQFRDDLVDNVGRKSDGSLVLIDYGSEILA